MAVTNLKLHLEELESYIKIFNSPKSIQRFDFQLLTKNSNTNLLRIIKDLKQLSTVVDDLSENPVNGSDLDGGFANSIYLTIQLADGGDANG